MGAVSVRDLRNHGGEILDRVARGEAVIVTRDGAEVATLSRLPRAAPSPVELIARRANLSAVDPRALRRDIDDILDSTL
jgi:antitoxin (DNA-binding transcriptional repressor) of toxin-antitoxin stability system